MKKIAIILFLLTSFVVKSQNKVDSIKVKSSWYGRVTPFSMYAGSGYLKDRVSQNIEFGRSFGVVDVGLVYGRISQRPDSTNFIEAKVTLDCFQLGRVSNEFSIGFGAVFNSKTPILLDVSYTIFVQVQNMWGVGLVTGYYDFSGNVEDSNKNYFGLFVRIGLQRTESGGIFSKKIHGHHR